MLLKHLLVVVILLCWMELGDGSRRLTLREKREEGLTPPPLVYPFGGTIKLLIGCAIPITVPGKILVYGQNLQFQYSLPQNASFFTDYFAPRKLRRRRQADIPDERSILYQYLEDELQRRGSPGKDCIKRSICEAAEMQLRNDGLVGEIFHVLLTPDYGGSTVGVVDEEYRVAAEAGRGANADCLAAYPACPEGFGLLDRITGLLDRD